LTYTIETRQLTSESTHGPSLDPQPTPRTVEAENPDDAVNLFVHQNDWELVSLCRPLGTESIATAKKDESVFLLRVYCD
jgi:hypothetical protein